MEEESMDLSGAVDMLKDMLSAPEGQQQIQNILNMFGGANPPEDAPPGEATGGISGDELDMMLKLQRAMSVMNSRKNSSQSQLLTALKPFLKPSRREKIDSAMRILSLSKVIEVMREAQGD